MNLSDVWTIFRKDWLQTLRDRNTLIIMLVGVLLLPLLSTGTAYLVQRRVESGTRTTARLIIVGEDAEWVAAELPPHKDFKALVWPKPDDLAGALRQATMDGALVLRVPKNLRKNLDVQKRTAVPKLKIYLDNRRDTLNERFIVTSQLDAWEARIRKSRMGTLPIPAYLSEEFSVKIRSLASNADRTGATFGLLLPIEITLTIVLLSLYSATELVTAERERGTLVLLAVAPPSRRDILTGKTLVVIATVALGSALALIAHLALLSTFVTKGGDMAGQYSLSIPMPASLFVVPIALPLIILLSAMSIALGSYVRNFQQAQSYASLLVILCMLPTLAPMLPTSDYPPVIAIFPIANTALMIRDALSGQLTWPFALATMISSCGYAFLSLVVATRILDSEHAVFPQDEPLGAWRTSARLLGTFLAGTFLAYFVIGQTVQGLDVLGGLIASQFLIIGAPAILFLRWLRLPVKEVLSLRFPKQLESIPAAILLSPGTFFLACGIMWVQDLFLPAPKALEEMITNILLPAGKPIWLAFLAIAATPAICEEILFRGLVQGTLIRSLPPRVVLPITAFAFGLFHMSAFRILPTGLLGLVLCYLTYRYESIFPSMALHLCHNALGVAVTAYHVNPFTWQNIIGATVCVVLALVLLRRRPA